MTAQLGGAETRGEILNFSQLKRARFSPLGMAVPTGQRARRRRLQSGSPSVSLRSTRLALLRRAFSRWLRRLRIAWYWAY